MVSVLHYFSAASDMELERIFQGFCILKIYKYLNTELLAIFFDGIVKIWIQNFQPKVPGVTLCFLANIVTHIPTRSVGNTCKCEQLFWTLRNSFFTKLYPWV